jgi:hypothetical protein
VPVDDGLKQTIAWFREHPDMLAPNEV